MGEGVGYMMLPWAPMMGWGCGPSATGAGFFGGFFFTLIFWALIIWAIVALVRYLSGQGRSENKESKALEILKERYAKGEIAKEEFEAKKKDLL